MITKLNKSISNFYHDMAINDLRISHTMDCDNKLTYNSMLYVEIIAAHQGEYTATMIADMLYISRPSVTQKINELEKMGYVIKKQSKTDKRIYYLYATDKVLEKNEEYYKSDLYVENKVCEEFSKESIDEFIKILKFIGDMYLEGVNK